MEIWEVLLVGAALAMDAVAVGMTDGMAEPRMPVGKTLFIALMFGTMQLLMPVFGYYAGGAFVSAVAKIAPWLSFALLLFIGGKAILGAAERKKSEAPRPVGAGKILLQGIATSIDALAVGVTFLATETTVGLPMSVEWCSFLIGVVTFALVVPAVCLGKKAGDGLSGKAELLGGIVLIAVGVKILLEGIL